MSWGPPSGAPSPDADRAGDASVVDLAELVRERGAVLLDALEDHRAGARDHADATASYAFAAAVELRLEREHAEVVREAARLHEVGTIYVPAATLMARPEDRDATGRALIDAHPGYGAELARGAGVPDAACDWIAASGERFDGRGPQGLAGERVALEGRIIRVGCACDGALTAPHPHSSAAEHRATAFATLGAAGGRELDPRIVAALTGMLDRVSRADRSNALTRGDRRFDRTGESEELPRIKKEGLLMARRLKPSPALVVALIALFVSIGGVGWLIP